MTSIDTRIKGLTDEEVEASRTINGSNELHYKKENGFLDAIKSLAKEPMVLLLLIASIIYFVSGKTGDGLFLASAIILVATISLYQDSRSRNALEKLKNFTASSCKVIRNSDVVEIKTEDLVIGDYIMVEEGSAIPADATIFQSNDFSVNESILTGESFSVFKDQFCDDSKIYRGTSVASGLAIAIVKAIGLQTKIGQIGKSLEDIKEEKTPLELQINNFVKKMVIVGAFVFVVVWLINFLKSYDVLDSLLKALTLAMSILPEEIPVALSTFMALGAWRLMKMGIVVKQMKTVETLGSATVICTDKTGTITENKMSLAKIYSLANHNFTNASEELGPNEKEIITLGMWASEPIPFDPMEIALHQSYEFIALEDERFHFKIIHEYPLDGNPPMMTHLFENSVGKRIIAAKGAPEALINAANLTIDEERKIKDAVSKLASEGFRLLGVGVAEFEENDFPATQQEFSFIFKGLVAFHDPPKHNITKVLKGFYAAGINVKIITGDNAETTAAIAKEIGFLGCEHTLSGDALMKMSDDELQSKILEIQIFTRMFPEAKLKIINALKAKGQIVAMTGDGINDGPALKAAHIGIAMGKKGTEIAKKAASLILLEDDLSRMLDAISMGRRIYSNLKKAIRYIISIHIPIVLTVFIPLALGWIYPNIFSPIHIIFLELIMGPTCSIIYENEPIEENTMLEKPRLFSTSFFSWKELNTSILQGLIITIGILIIYQLALSRGYSEALTRTMVFTALISSNLFLTLVNRSFYYSIFTTIKYKNNMVVLIICITIFIAGLLLSVKPLLSFFGFEKMNLDEISISIGIGFASVMWFELVKWRIRKQSKLKKAIEA